MKRLYILFFIFLTLPSFGIIANDFNDKCGANKYDNLYAVFEPISYTCNAGYFLPANTMGCQPCPAGYTCAGGTYSFNPTMSQGLTRTNAHYTANQTNACATNFGHTMYAVFEPISYTCDAGYFLPANTAGCQPCPAGYTCPGGTYSANSKESQGLTRVDTYYTANEAKACAANFNHALNAKFEPKQYNCNAGQYLPANTDGCANCLANSFCPGGTYYFNESDAQGITACSTLDNGAYPNSSAQSSANKDCYRACSGNVTIEHATDVTGNDYYGVGVDTCAATACDLAYHVENGACIINTITINWNGTLQSDIDANDAGATTYGGDIRTPRAAIDIPGKRFLGWRFSKPVNQ